MNKLKKVANLFKVLLSAPGKKRIHFCKFIKLQLLFLMHDLGLNKPTAFKWISPLQLNLARGDHGMTGNYYLGLLEYYDMGFLIHLLRPNDYFVDIGANQGSYSLLGSGLCGANTVAFEPVSTTYQRLLENISINQLNHNIETKKVVLTSEKIAKDSPKILFSTDLDSCNSVVDESYSGTKEIIECSSLDRQIEGINPFLIKIDVEGFDEDVLAGAKNTLRANSLVAVIIEGQTESINKLFRDHGFSDFAYSPSERTLNMKKKWTPNRIWIRFSKLEMVKKRLMTAKKRLIHGSIL